MVDAYRETLAAKVFASQDQDGCWNVLAKDSRYYPDFNFYVPNFKSTLWTLILLADIGLDPDDKRVKRPLNIMIDHFTKNGHEIGSIGKSHFPIPCLNGNILYLLSYFNRMDYAAFDVIIDFFDKYQRFDDGDYRTPTKFPYFSNRSCYGKHTCYWGVVKLLKGLSFIPKENRSNQVNNLIQKCIAYILKHNVCYSSHEDRKELSRGITRITFPNMYGSDILEILWILQRERIISEKMSMALDILQSKTLDDGTWKIDRKIGDLVVPIGKYVNAFITERAKGILAFYDNTYLANIT